MKVLGIETSCDETAVSVVSNKREIISNFIFSQIDIHKKFGGVVPEVAARNHYSSLDSLVKKALEITPINEIDAFAVTSEPGLISGLIVGVMAAKTISSITNKPIIPVNHLHAHALTIRLTHNIDFPYLLLLVSGGHCKILVVKSAITYEEIGCTIDDALGESFDKVAQMIGLTYPGGPIIEKKAQFGDENRFLFPKPLLYSKNKFCFSFSGLKTSVKRKIEELTKESFNSFSYKKLKEEDICNIAASFQKTVSLILINRLKNSLKFVEKIDISNLVIAGGVAANQYLYQKISYNLKDRINILVPPINLCTDNAAMVAWTGIEKLNLGITSNLAFVPKAKCKI